MKNKSFTKGLCFVARVNFNITFHISCVFIVWCVKANSYFFFNVGLSKVRVLEEFIVVETFFHSFGRRNRK